MYQLVRPYDPPVSASQTLVLQKCAIVPGKKILFLKLFGDFNMTASGRSSALVVYIMTSYRTLPIQSWLPLFFCLLCRSGVHTSSQDVQETLTVGLKMIPAASTPMKSISALY